MSTSILDVPKAGDPAPELRLSTQGGKLVVLADLRGAPVLVSFLSHAA